MQRLILQPIPNIIEIYRVASETKHANQQLDRHTILIMHSLHVRCANNTLKLYDLLSALKEMSS
jgi:hypothetical protein